MLVVFRSDPVDQTVGLENIFVAEDFLGLCVLPVCSENLAGNRLVTFLRVTTGLGIHLHQYTLLVRRSVPGVYLRTRCREHQQGC
jgi:hypothetical protein